MSNQDTLKKAIETLKKLQIETHDAMDDSHRESLEQAIRNLEECEAKGNTISSAQLLILFGKMLNCVPFIEQIIKNWPM